MIVIAPENALTKQQQSAVWSILCLCQNEFVPPLSQRASTTQVFNGQKESTSFLPTAYFKALLKQSFMLVLDNDQTIGFLSYQTDYANPLFEAVNPSTYVTTICIHPDYRGRGALNQLYDALEQKMADQIAVKQITTRTWSTNEAQIHTLAKRGYQRIKTIPNDRGPGIDSLYFAKEMHR